MSKQDLRDAYYAGFNNGAAHADHAGRLASDFEIWHNDYIDQALSSQAPPPPPPPVPEPEPTEDAD